MTDMTDDLNDGFSLASLAEIDVSEIEEVRFVNLPAGTYDFEVNKAELAEDTKDGKRRFKVEVELKIVECRSSLEANVDRDSLAGRMHTERFFIKPEESQEDVLKQIGRIRAFVTDIGQDSKGTLGAIVENMKGHQFSAKIVKQKDKTDPSIEYARLKLEPARK